MPCRDGEARSVEDRPMGSAGDGREGDLRRSDGRQIERGAMHETGEVFLVVAIGGWSDIWNAGVVYPRDEAGGTAGIRSMHEHHTAGFHNRHSGWRGTLTPCCAY